ncbi:hypothetical protein TRFO_22316 [Tritrichomonas foetus]|uniref:Uncharacterized protein n=1 Tax=Tritrichomonas foetus TaxID=1144522 RepID=A0A1J4KC31_9EUKA|nr:hypothetical protein TRFO_22316 [Tritrichomonas foetus]|eukprot:OHT08977.1 hypothetical protein TRFO_22316 [Tritrichomonas foetus]
MEIGESVYCVSSIPNTPTKLAVGCESGKLFVNDIETNKSLYSADNPDSIIVIRPTDDHIIFAATEEQIICHDTRAGHTPKLIFTLPSEISDFVVNGDLFVMATYSNDIITSDRRLLRKSQAPGILPSVCSSLSFQDAKHLIAGYLDTTVGSWDFNTNKFSPFTVVKSQQFNPSVVHCVASKSDIVAVARQTGLNIYKNGQLQCDSLFEHGGAVQAVAFAECFETPFTVSGAADGSLMVFDCTKLEPLDCLTVENEKVQCITSNSRVIAVADTSDNGNIGIFTPQDFLEHGSDEEENENEEEGEKQKPE